MNVRDALREGAATLKKHRCAGTRPDRETEELLAWAAGVSRESLFAHPERALKAAETRRFRAALAARVKHVPVEYLVGRAPFMGRDFRVTKATLIPRPATETMVGAAIVEARRLRATSLTDVGTGSGAIAITLAAAFPDARVLATDISPAALNVARANAAAHGVSERVTFLRADLLPEPLPASDAATVIVANLPYVPSASKARLSPDVTRHEPASALFGGKDGLSPSKRLLDRLAAAKFSGPVTLFLEILPSQCRAMERYAAKRLPGWRIERVMNEQGVASGLALFSDAPAKTA
ncbi:MAG: peptide chain release factor N(5)-glutamine methyltransferase [Candidatus Parcubacteria bacterium]|jgi:release factor glutamine methyltransferase